MTARLGFLGVGWIGRDRLDAVAASGAGTVAAVADLDEAAAAAAAAATGAHVVSPEGLLRGECDLDGVVVATPSALHAAQCAVALEHGLAVFCQKPLARSAEECSTILEAARRSDRRLDVDLSYRHLSSVEAVRQVLARGDIGDVYAVEATFHNAYGPDKAWFRDPALAGGGCLIDLGTHLVDLVLWLLGWPAVEQVTSRLYASGRPADPGSLVEDLALVDLDLEGGRYARLECSWFLDAGVDAVIGLTLRGTAGALRVENLDGSFYDFRALLLRGTSRELLCEERGGWGGRAAVAWAEAVGAGARFDLEAAEEHLAVAKTIDGAYRR